MINPEERGPIINSEEKYREIFTRIETTNIIPTEAKELDLEKLKQCMDDVFREYGERSIEENDGKIFMTLSGGLDSTFCLAFLRKNFPDNEIVTFTMGGYKEHPDVVHSRIAAKEFKTQHNEFIPKPNEIGDALEEYREKFSEKLEEGTKFGDFDTYFLLKQISEFKPKVLMSHDGIDELMGGYPEHKQAIDNESKKKFFVECWQKVVLDHLKPLVKAADVFDIEISLPYLDERLIDEISHISLDDRTSKEVTKKPLREIARNLRVPIEIIERKKEGRIGVLKREE